jgi:predicted metallopeptidase
MLHVKTNVLLISECFLVQVPLPVPDHISPAQVTAENQYESLAAVVTPLWQTPYKEQLAIKLQWSQSVMQNVVKKLHRQAKSKNVKRILYRLHHVKPSVSGSYNILYPKLNKKRLSDPTSMIRICLDLFSSVRNFLVIEPEVSSPCSQKPVD